MRWSHRTCKSGTSGIYERKQKFSRGQSDPHAVRLTPSADHSSYIHINSYLKVRNLNCTGPFFVYFLLYSGDSVETISMFGVLQTTTARKRRRPQLSCLECRRRKVKCDRTDPCGQCRQTKSKTCTYTYGARQNQRDEGSAEMDPVQSAHPRPPSRGRGPYQVAAADTGPMDIVAKNDFLSEMLTPIGPPSNNSINNGRTVDDLLERVKHLEDKLASAGSESTDKRIEPVQTLGELCPFTSQNARGVRGNLAKTRFFGQSHWMGSLTQVSRCLSLSPYSISMLIGAV